MLIFQMNRIISSEKCFNYEATFFLLKMPEIWVGRTTLNGEKKRGWPKVNLPILGHFLYITFEKYLRSLEAIYSRTIVLR